MNTQEIKAKLSFLTGKESDLNTDAIHIGEQLTVSEDKFPSLLPKVTSGIVIINAYTTALSKAKGAGTKATAAKNITKANLQVMLRKWAAQVSIDSAGNMETFLSSGFTPRSNNHTQVEVSTPASPKVTNSVNEGKIKLRTSKMRGAHSYSFRYTVVNPATATEQDWVVLDPSSTHTQTEGLAVASTVYVSVRANGVANISDFSEPTVFRVGLAEPKTSAKAA